MHVLTHKDVKGGVMLGKKNQWGGGKGSNGVRKT